MSPASKSQVHMKSAPSCAPETYAEIARILYAKTGINLPADNGSLVVSRLVKHLRALNLSDFESYLRWVGQPEHSDDLNTMISSLTTNTTRFYREPYHFDIFVEQQLPELMRKAKNGERIRL
jgi:chemotaxis protein methyltransferase CheR